ncbi:reverse transcriptase domain-containing protein [Tanacetum coccineum]
MEEWLTKEFHTKAANEINSPSLDKCKAVYADEKTSLDNGRHGISIASNKCTQSVQTNDVSPKILPCQLPPKELNPGNFTLPCTIGSLNFYAMADLGASVNVIPKSIFEHLKLARLKKTDMLVEMADMTKRSPIGIVKNVLVKIDKFLFPSDFVVMNMLNTRNETMILGRPFLATIHAEIDGAYGCILDYGMASDDYKGPPVFDDDQYEKESVPVYDTNIEDIIEEEEGFVGKGGIGGEEDNIEDIVVVDELESKFSKREDELLEPISGSEHKIKELNNIIEGSGNAGSSHYARDYQKPRVHDAKYFREQILLAIKDEAGSNLEDKDNDFMLDNSYRDKTLEELTVAAVSEVENNGGTSKHDSTAHDEYQDIKMLSYNYKETCEELEREIRADKDTIERILKEKDKIKSEYFKFENEKIIIQHETQLAKKAFKEREDRYLEDICDLEEKLSSHARIVYKMGQSIQIIHMLGKEPNKVYDPFLKAGLGYKNTERLKKDIAAQLKMYDGEMLHSTSLKIDSPDSEKILEDAEENRLKMRNKMVKINF